MNILSLNISGRHDRNYKAIYKETLKGEWVSGIGEWPTNHLLFVFEWVVGKMLVAGLSLLFTQWGRLSFEKSKRNFDGKVTLFLRSFLKTVINLQKLQVS